MKILFTSSRPLDRAENVKAVWDALDCDKHFAQIDPYGECAEAVDAEVSGYDVIVTDEFIKQVNFKSHCKIVMIEHGLTGAKKYGLDQKVRYYTPEQTSLIDYYVTSSEAGRSIASSCSAVPVERCLPLGMPRTDFYFGKRKGDGGTGLADKTVYLFAPTLRAGWEPPQPVIDWDTVDSMLEDDEVVVVKRHMCMPRPILDRDYRHVIEAQPSVPSSPYLIDCDVVMTDYSSIILDGYLLGKPSFLYCPDSVDYLDRRGMYRDYPSGYSSHWLSVDYPEMIVPMLRRTASDGMGDADFDCMEFTAGACDGHSSQRVADLVRSLS